MTLARGRAGTVQSRRIGRCARAAGANPLWGGVRNSLGMLGPGRAVRVSTNKEAAMRKKLQGAPAIVIAVTALFVAIGGGYAIGAGFIGTGDLKNQAVTNKKIKKKTIKGEPGRAQHPDRRPDQRG